jgi:hypothetical protein
MIAVYFKGLQILDRRKAEYWAEDIKILDKRTAGYIIQEDSRILERRTGEYPESDGESYCIEEIYTCQAS